jgi:hypothetical protein
MRASANRFFRYPDPVREEVADPYDGDSIQHLHELSARSFFFIIHVVASSSFCLIGYILAAGG